eukprot:TRINITY_DN38269_c0_g1_i1.p1 TRINITY_DN38269_c0_g1~~TRINITY_DN38269_c0_g1_i1.p1  ORF type:complete len:445 (-),score=69.33 TRINITY_DN38269_c0_g1_i1:365-1699(-)
MGSHLSFCAGELGEPYFADSFQSICVKAHHERRFIWITILGNQPTPADTRKLHFFNTDTKFIYEPFWLDNGPIDIGFVVMYCRMVAQKLKDPACCEQNIVHWCSSVPQLRTNAAFLFCAYQVLVLGTTPEEANKPFMEMTPQLMTFRDATRRDCGFRLTMLDCLRGLKQAVAMKWVDWSHFDVSAWERLAENNTGHMSWIIPGKILAFAGPSTARINHTPGAISHPEDYVPIFKASRISLVIRLNAPEYEKDYFVRAGIRHVDLIFKDGSCPPPNIVSRFFEIVDSEPGAVAVHCKAGLGRTSTLIGLYAMRQGYFNSARSFIGWCRLCRPGSVLGVQQQYLVWMERHMVKAGKDGSIDSDRRLESRFSAENCSTAPKTVLGVGEEDALCEDIGQGESLCDSKRKPSQRQLLHAQFLSSSSQSTGVGPPSSQSSDEDILLSAGE